MKRLELLDYARLGAALAVVAFHYLFQAIYSGHLTSISAVPSLVPIAKYGHLGVDLFFIISGYVIFFSARGRSAGEFAAARGMRLYPAFWAAVLFSATLIYAWGTPEMSVNLRQVALNLTMIPSFLGAVPVDGVYWTLFVELTFYVVVAGVLALGLQKHLSAIFLAWPLAMLAAWTIGRDGIPLLGGYYTYFAAGALFAIMRDRITPFALAATAVTLFLCIDGAIARSVTLEAARGVPYSPTVLASLIVAMFAFFFALNTTKGQALKLPASRLAGALTYPLYLIHSTVGLILLSRFATERNKAFAYLGVFAFVLVMSYVLHVLVERRMARWWTTLFNHAVAKPIDRILSIAFRRRTEAMTAANSP